MSTNSGNNTWFSDWFDSPYYHLLYSNRDQKEAKAFILRLMNYLGLPGGSSVLDLACGKGRHSKTIASLGMQVVGLDLSPSSIEEANQEANENLSFLVGDMRNLTFDQDFDLVVNLFTSFGYFTRLSDNSLVLEGVKRALKPGGTFVLDFFNGTKVKNTLVKNEVVQRGSIDFELNRSIEDGRVIKDIRFHDKEDHHFQERVQLIFPDDFKDMLQRSGFEIIHTFGSYSLDAFNEQRSDRFILIARLK